MTEPGLDLAGLRAAVAQAGRLVRVVVAEAAGSAPRGPGAAMMVWSDGQAGTIGGGALEWQAIGRARAMLGADEGAARAERLALGPTLGQCCGGAVTIVYEVWDAARLGQLTAGGGAGHLLRPILPTASPEAPAALRRAAARAAAQGGRAPLTMAGGWLLEPLAARPRDLWVWGAGHVGRAVVGLMAPLPGWAITWVDHAAGCFPADPPAEVTCRHDPDPARLVPDAPPGADHLVMTRSHPLDLAICHGLLSQGAACIGLIGSATKAARFHARLRALGHTPARIARLTCPIGTPELGKHPQAIAIGVAASLIRPGAAGWERAAV
jgi:xanthine dehydrogenase accessory factor